MATNPENAVRDPLRSSGRDSLSFILVDDQGEERASPAEDVRGTASGGAVVVGRRSISHSWRVWEYIANNPLSWKSRICRDLGISDKRFYNCVRQLTAGENIERIGWHGRETTWQATSAEPPKFVGRRPIPQWKNGCELALAWNKVSNVSID